MLHYTGSKMSKCRCAYIFDSRANSLFILILSLDFSMSFTYLQIILTYLPSPLCWFTVSLYSYATGAILWSVSKRLNSLFCPVKMIL
jgi:hypothetical protein